jgi:CHASE2 domain-containing sensor protein
VDSLDIGRGEMSRRRVFLVPKRLYFTIVVCRSEQFVKIRANIGQLRAISGHKLFRPTVGAGLAGVCGLALWLAGAWEHASYDQLFRFGARPITNQLALIVMDNDAYNALEQSRDSYWSRTLHAKLLNRLADDGCPLVVFDVFFEKPGDPAEDRALADAMRRQRQIALVATQQVVEFRIAAGGKLIPPTEPFLSAARTNLGVAEVDTNLIVRQHWPLPGQKLHLSLLETAASLAGGQLTEAKQKRWMRYYGYGQDAAWTSLSYGEALSQPTNFFQNKIVFIGNKPATLVPDGEVDEFRTPYTHWTGEAVGGVEILATQFLNLMNGDWLRRLPWWAEVLGLLAMGALLGMGLSQVRLWAACLAAAGISLAVMLGAACLSYFSNFWFPWLIIAGGQVPVTLAWTLVAARVRPKPEVLTATVVVPREPEPPDYERFEPPFGEGGFGKVWVVRNAIGQWQALKEVYKVSFGDDAGKFEIEFNGIQKYKPISHEHPGLLRIEFVSREKPGGFFYYVMELGDALDPDCGWQQNPTLYKPRDLRNVCARAERKRLPVRECIEIGIRLADALDFLHRQGLTHRDIKPGNVIFVNGQPKLADAGTVTALRPPEQINTRLVSRGYTPAGEAPGTRQADIYSLGKLLYVISTGRDPEDDFPALTTTLLEHTGPMDFMELNKVIIKACQPNPSERYASAMEMHKELLAVLGAVK